MITRVVKEDATMASNRPTRRRHPVVMLSVLVAAIATLSGCDLMMADLSAQATDQWQKTYTLAAGGRVTVLNINGKIDVEPSTGNTVEIRAEKIAKGASEQAAREALTRIEILEQASEGDIRIETRVPKTGLFGQGGLEVRYFVKVPAGTALHVRTINGGLNLANLSGALRAETTNGGIDGRGLSGSLDGGTTNGGIDVQMDKVAEGGVKLETTNGGIDLRIPKDTPATVTARLANGRIDVSTIEIQARGEITRRRLDGTMNGGGAPITLETTNGGISIGAR
jgi:hypothetical protein